MIHLLQRWHGQGQIVRLSLVTGGVVIGKLRSFVTHDDAPPGVEVEGTTNDETIFVNVNHIVSAELAN